MAAERLTRARAAADAADLHEDGSRRALASFAVDYVTALDAGNSTRAEVELSTLRLAAARYLEARVATQNAVAELVAAHRADEEEEVARGR